MVTSASSQKWPLNTSLTVSVLPKAKVLEDSGTVAVRLTCNVKHFTRTWFQKRNIICFIYE